MPSVNDVGQPSPKPSASVARCASSTTGPEVGVCKTTSPDDASQSVMLGSHEPQNTRTSVVVIAQFPDVNAWKSTSSAYGPALPANVSATRKYVPASMTALTSLSPRAMH